MSHFLTVTLNENGVIADPNIKAEIGSVAIPPFRFTDVFIYSHGWWNSATRAANEYNLFSLGFSKCLQELLLASPGAFARITTGFSALAMGIHWPSMISENQTSVANFLEATSFFTMQTRADAVGKHGIYSLLRLLIAARVGQPPLRFHLIGHSFGCRVLCAALQTLTQDAPTLAQARDIATEFNLVLLQAACDDDSLAIGNSYGNILTDIPNLRLMMTTSDNDKALGDWYPTAQSMAHLFRKATPALGSVGPSGRSGRLGRPVTDELTLASLPAPLQTGDFSVVDLTPLHRAHADVWGDSGGWGGQHSDINLPEIYELVARFLGN